MLIEFDNGNPRANGMAAMAVAMALLEPLSEPDKKHTLSVAHALLRGDQADRIEARRMLMELIRQIGPFQ